MEQLNIESWNSTLLGETLLFGLLGKIIYQDLNRSLLESLIKDEVFNETPFGESQTEVQHGMELLSFWSRENANGISDTEFDLLKQDHLKLFIGLNIMPTPPWESVYFSEKHMVFQEQTIQVREWYARFGVQAERINNEPDDHIGLEMLFISHLASLALQAIKEDDQNKLNDILQAQRDFLSEHLLRWGPVWAKLVKQYANTDFYRGIAHLTHGALLAIAETLEIKMPKEVSL
jgi:TorA maturation chaperone TorD